MRDCDLGGREVRIVGDVGLNSYVDVLLGGTFAARLFAVRGFIYPLLTDSTDRLNLPELHRRRRTKILLPLGLLELALLAGLHRSGSGGHRDSVLEGFEDRVRFV